MCSIYIPCLGSRNIFFTPATMLKASKKKTTLMKTEPPPRIGEHVIQHVDFIRQLCAPHKPRSRSSEIRQHLIRDATADQLLALVECCFNILKSRVPLTKSQLRRLNMHADKIRSLARVRTPANARRILLRDERHIVQRGRGLAIVPSLASLISSILFPMLASSINK